MKFLVVYHPKFPIYLTFLGPDTFLSTSFPSICLLLSSFKVTYYASHPYNTTDNSYTHIHTHTSVYI